MADTTVANLKELKPGMFIMIDGEPCKVVDVVKSKPGKHGAAKIRLEGVSILDGKKRFLMKPADSDVDVPMIDKKAAQVLTISGDMAQLMDLTDYSTFDALIPEEFKGKLEAGREVLYWRVGNKILIKELR